LIDPRPDFRKLASPTLVEGNPIDVAPPDDDDDFDPNDDAAVVAGEEGDDVGPLPGVPPVELAHPANTRAAAEHARASDLRTERINT